MTFEQLIDRVRQLPEEDRVDLVCQVFDIEVEDSSLVSLKRRFGMSQNVQDRMSDLTEKSLARTMSVGEEEELAGLVSDFRDRALAMARAAAKR